MEKWFVDRESSLLQEKQNRIDLSNMLDDFIQEDSRVKNFEVNSTSKRSDKIKLILSNSKNLKEKNEEIMEDYKDIRNPTTFSEYQKRSFRRWVGSEGKYIIPKTH